MIKRVKNICYILLVSMMFTACSRVNEENNAPESTDSTIEQGTITESLDTVDTDTVTEEEANSEFYALGKTYYGNAGFEGLSNNDEIVNSNNYVQGQYKEIDFAIDLVAGHLLADNSIYSYLISTDDNGDLISLTEEDRAKVASEMYSFKVEQYGVYEDTPLYFNFMSAQFLGFDGQGVKLYIRGTVSGYGISYIVTVYEQGNNLVAKLK